MNKHRDRRRGGTAGDESTVDFAFNLTKAAQAAAVLLRARPSQRMSYLRLLKLLFLADREMMTEKLHTITGDQAIAMKKGPVLSRLYHLVKEEVEGADAQEWSRFFRRDGHEVVLHTDPGTGELSRYEKDRLLALLEKYSRTDDWELVELTHEMPEWREFYAGENAEPREIPWAAALRAAGKADLIDEAVREERTRRAFDEVLGKA